MEREKKIKRKNWQDRQTSGDGQTHTKIET